MLKKNEQYEIEITDISSDGSGVGQIDGFAVFVPMTAIGDVAEIVIVKVLSRYAIGRALSIVNQSVDRKEPECPVFKRCGGCQLQHIKYDAQLRIKKNFIENAFRRIGGFEGFVCDDMIGMENPRRYRNKCIFPIGRNKQNEIVSGFYARRSHDIIEIDDCIAGPSLNEKIVTAVKEYMRESNVSVYDEDKHTGLVRRVFIRNAVTTGEVMAVISINGKTIPNRERLIKRIIKAVPETVSVYLNINTDKTNNVLGKENKLIYGKEEITDTLCGTEFKISPHSFYQINPIMTEKLYGRALDYAAITKDDTVLDVYCGIGTISLAAAKRAKKAVGVEIVEQAIINARENALNNGIKNAVFYADSAENAVPKLIDEGMKPDIVILDPPRKGSDEATLRAIAKAEPKRIVYVSCNPATVARDAAFLDDLGYKPVKCTGVDMFPQTCHVETVCLMLRICSGE